MICKKLKILSILLLSRNALWTVIPEATENWKLYKPTVNIQLFLFLFFVTKCARGGHKNMENDSL